MYWWVSEWGTRKGGLWEEINPQTKALDFQSCGFLVHGSSFLNYTCANLREKLIYTELHRPSRGNRYFLYISKSPLQSGQGQATSSRQQNVIGSEHIMPLLPKLSKIDIIILFKDEAAECQGLSNMTSLTQLIRGPASIPFKPISKALRSSCVFTIPGNLHEGNYVIKLL